jgi:hypothetical protein
MTLRLKAELVEEEKLPLLGNYSVNTFPQQPTHLTAVTGTNTTIQELLETMFSVGSVYKNVQNTKMYTNMFPA